MMLRTQLGALQRKLRAGITPDQRFLERLVRHWHNEAWSASTELLHAMLRWLPLTKGPILECGSGLSSLVLAAAIPPSRRLLSIEHDPAWSSRVRAAMSRKLANRAQIALAPLRSYGSYDWYAIERLQLPSQIGFVVCDGPPGSTRGGRYGFWPLLRERLAPGCIVLLDDTDRPDEHAIAKRWCMEMSATIIEESQTFCVLKRDGAAAATAPGA